MSDSNFGRDQIISVAKLFCRKLSMEQVSAPNISHRLPRMRFGTAVVCVLGMLASGGAAAEVQQSQRLDAENLVEISIDYNWMGWGTKKYSYLIRHNETGWIANERTAVRQETIEAVLASLTGLHPSDRLRSCMSHTDDYPRFRILLRKVESVIELTSDSNCAAYAPWNVIKAGQLKVQYNGGIGRAITRLLTELDPDTWKADRESNIGGVNLTGGEKPPKGIVAAEPPALKFKQTLSKSARYRNIFGAASPGISRLYCDFATSPECDRITGRASVAWSDRVEFEFAVTFLFALVTRIEVADDFDKQLAALERSKLLAAFDVPASNPRISVSFTGVDNCTKERAFAEYVKRIAGKLPDAGKRSNCDYYFVSVAGESEDKYPPSIFFYPSIGIAWLRSGEASATAAYYERLGIPKDLLARIKSGSDGWIYSDLKGKVTELGDR